MELNLLKVVPDIDTVHMQFGVGQNGKAGLLLFLQQQHSLCAEFLFWNLNCNK